MAPENFKGEYSSKSDIWALGCVLFVLVSGKRPFDCDNFGQLIKDIELGVYEEPVCSVECKDLISKMISVNVIKRFSVD